MISETAPTVLLLVHISICRYVFIEITVDQTLGQHHVHIQVVFVSAAHTLLKSSMLACVAQFLIIQSYEWFLTLF